MSRAPDLEPRWLVGLLAQWACRSLYAETLDLGWYTKSPMLADGIPGRVQSYEPTGYGAEDFADVEQAVKALPVMRRLAVLRYFKPWMRDAIQAVDEALPRDPETWMRQLKLALGELQEALDRHKASLAVR